MPDAFARLLRRIIKDGTIPRSQVSRSSLKRLQSLLDADVIQKVRRGGGFVLELREPESLISFYRGTYPSLDLPEGISPRARSVGTFRSAKRVACTDREPRLMRAIRPLGCSRDGVKCDILAGTLQTGAVCLVIEKNRFWSMSGAIAVVENLECFLYFERMDVEADAALYTAGRLSDLTLQWLGSLELSGCRFIHCGDYDPVGLDEYLRLKEVVGDRVRMHVPENLSRLISTLGRPELIRNPSSSSLLSRLRASDDADIKRIVKIMDETGRGLEQEALLIR